MNAIEIADTLEETYGYPTQASDMLRRQHEAILKLRVALGTLSYATEWGVDLDSAQADAEKALKETEDLK